MMSDVVAALAAWIWKFRTEKPSRGSGSVKSPLGSKNSSGAMAPLRRAVVRSPSALTTVMPRRQDGVFLSAFRRAMKNACWIWLFGCRPWSQGKTCEGSGRGSRAIWSSAFATSLAPMLKTDRLHSSRRVYFEGG